MAAEKNIGFSVTIRGVSKEAQELARLEVQMKSLRKAKLDLIKQSQKEGQVSAENTRKIAALTNQINANAASQKQLKRAITPVQSSFVRLGKTILTSLGIFASAAMVVRGFFNVIKNGFKTSWDFEYAMSQVKAITKATSEDFNKLRENAIALGGATKFTASEVASLQKEYAKLGFSITEILRITKATLDLAAATGTDLATSSKVAGATLRQFQLDATKMTHVVDVMALSFSSSALDMAKFETAMQNAGPVAKAVGETIESTSAKLAVLANSGLDASISGTSLRNIFLELERRGLTWDQAMKKIQGSQNKASTSLELFGKRGAVAGIILADNNEKIKEFDEAFQKADGSAKEMADTMLDNVQGSATILKSAWEGLTLRTNQSNGALKGFIDTLTLLVTTINTKGKPSIDSLFESRQITTFSDRMRFAATTGIGFWGSLTSAIFRSNKALQEYSDELSEIMRKENERLLEIETARLEKEEAERTAKDEELKRIQALVDAEEKRREQIEKAFKQRIEDIQEEGEALKEEEAFYDTMDARIIKSIIDNAKAREDAREEEKKARSQEMEQLQADIIKRTDLEIEELKRRNEAIKILEQANYDNKVRIMQAATDVLAGLAGKNKALRKASLIADKAVAIAEIIMQTKRANAAMTLYGAAMAIPTGGFSIAAAQAINIKNNIIAGLSIAAIIAATATALAGFVKGGKINRGIPVNTGTKDDTLIVANKTETVLTKDHVARLGGPGVMKRIGVPGYAQGGYIGQTPPEAQFSGFDINQLADLMNSIEVTLNLNKVDSGLKELEVINKSQPL